MGSRTARVYSLRAAPALALFLATCGPRASHVELEPQATIFAHHGSVTLHATALDDRGTSLPELRPVWSSSDPETASVDGAGQVQALRNGVVTITASVSGASADCKLKVWTPTALSAPDSFNAKASGLPVTLPISAQDKMGARFFEPALELQSNAPAVVGLDGHGNILPLTPGSATITARNGDLTAKLPVTVTALEFDGLVAGFDAEMINNLAELSQAVGAGVQVTVVSPKGPKKTRVSADDPSRITHATVGLSLGSERVLPATVTLRGSPVAPVAATWTSSDTAVVEVTAAGKATGRQKGSATLTATFGGRTAEVPIHVK